MNSKLYREMLQFFYDFNFSISIIFIRLQRQHSGSFQTAEDKLILSDDSQFKFELSIGKKP